MKVRILYDQGSARVAEDGIIFRPPHCYGVLDSYSGLYLPQGGPKMFDRLTGGQVIARIIMDSSTNIPVGYTISWVTYHANDLIRAWAEKQLLHDGAFLPGASWCMSSMSGPCVDVTQGGDCLAVWEWKNGTFGGTVNQMYNYEAKLRRTIAGLMEKHGSDRRAMWKEFAPILMEARRNGANTDQGKFAILNGNPNYTNFVQSFSFNKDELRTLLLFSDGLVPFELTRDSRVLAETVLQQYREGGLHHVLARTRQKAEAEKATSHEDLPEATAIALEF